MSAAKELPVPKETVTAKISRWAAGLEYKHLSKDAVYQAKRFLLDSVGCALGGFQQHDVKIALEVLDEVAGRGPATVIGTGNKIDVVSASLANALMIRCMDYNDIRPSSPSKRHFRDMDQDKTNLSSSATTEKRDDGILSTPAPWDLSMISTPAGAAIDLLYHHDGSLGDGVYLYIIDNEFNIDHPVRCTELFYHPQDG